MSRKFYVKSRKRDKYVCVGYDGHSFEVDCLTDATIFKSKEEAINVANSWSSPNVNGYDWRVLSFIHA